MAATAVRVFGNPITDGTPAQRAQAAMNNQNAGGKLDQAVSLIQQGLVGKPSAADQIITNGKVYNATGSTITYVMQHIWEGKILVGSYTAKVANGQWVVFAHSGIPIPHQNETVAALVYNIKNSGDAMIAWNNPGKTSEAKCSAYCEMKDAGYFKECDWDQIHTNLLASGDVHHATKHFFTTKVSIEADGNTANYTAIMSLGL